MLMEDNVLINNGLPVAIALLMCGLGLHLTMADFGQIVRFPRSMLVGLAGHYLLLPALGFGIAWLLRLPPELAVGLVLIAACPSGTMANTMTFLARGNVALGVSLSLVSALVTFLSIPLLVGLASGLFAGSTQPVSVPMASTIRHLAGLLLVPIICGMAIRAWAPGSHAARRTVGGSIRGAADRLVDRGHCDLASGPTCRRRSRRRGPRPCCSPAARSRAATRSVVSPACRSATY